MPLLEEFIEAFGVWEEGHPYIQLMVDEQEMRLIVAMKGQAVTVDEAARLLDLTQGEAAALLARAYHREIVHKADKDGAVAYTPSDFYARLDCFAKFENWNDIPLEGRRALDRSYLDRFIARNIDKIEHLKRGEPFEGHLPNADIMLLPEMEEMIGAASEFVIHPCDCRLLGQYCDRPVETCVAMDRFARMLLDRGHGRAATKEEVIELVRYADRKGLMHTSTMEWRERGPMALCNCCGCDCYPFRAGQELGTKGLWPKVRYVAVHDETACTHCAACVRRCHFDAFHYDDTTIEVNGKTRARVRFSADRCWGCGLCANTCPAQAITMQSLAEE